MKKYLLALLLCGGAFVFTNGQHISPSYRDADTSWLEQLLYSGKEWRPRISPVTGHEFFLTSDNLEGSVTVDGITFEGLKLKYDIYDDQLIVIWKDIHAIVLNNSIIDAFSVRTGPGNDPRRSGRNFINLREDYPAIRGYAEVIYRNKSMVVATHRKVIAKNVSLSTYAQYRDDSRYWFISGGKCMPLRNRASFLSMLGDYEDEVKRFIRQNHLVVGNLSPEGYSVAAAFYDSLTSGEAGD
jgi:hypothetical protein